MRKHRTLLTAAVLLAFAFSAVPAAAAPANQVPGEKPGPPEEKKYCLSTKASHTFLNASGSSQLKYKVTVAPKLCLLYTNVKNTVSGKSVTQPRVHGYSYDVRVSHSGYLPADASGKAVLPEEIGGYNYTNAPMSASFGALYLEPAGDKFVIDGESESDPVLIAGEEAWASLVEAGFKCSKGKCRPVKSSAAETNSGPFRARFDAQARYMAYVDVTFKNQYNVVEQAAVFWDHGTAPVVAAGVSRPQNSFKREKVSLREGFCGSGTYLGVPVTNRGRDLHGCG